MEVQGNERKDNVDKATYYIDEAEVQELASQIAAGEEVAMLICRLVKNRPA